MTFCSKCNVIQVSARDASLFDTSCLSAQCRQQIQHSLATAQSAGLAIASDLVSAQQALLTAFDKRFKCPHFDRQNSANTYKYVLSCGVSKKLLYLFSLRAIACAIDPRHQRHFDRSVLESELCCLPSQVHGLIKNNDHVALHIFRFTNTTVSEVWKWSHFLKSHVHFADIAVATHSI